MNAIEHVWVRCGNLIVEVRNNLSVLDPCGVKGIGEYIVHVLARSGIFKGKTRYVSGVVERNQHLLIFIKLVRVLIIIELGEQVHVTVVMVLGRTHINLLPCIIRLKTPYLDTPVIAQFCLLVGRNLTLNTYSRQVGQFLVGGHNITQVGLVTKVHTHLVAGVLATSNPGLGQ